MSLRREKERGRRQREIMDDLRTMGDVCLALIMVMFLAVVAWAVWHGIDFGGYSLDMPVCT
jgi:hypothetical protein